MNNGALLRHRGFRSLFVAQLLGAFNDNVFKMVVSLVAVNSALGHAGGYLSLVGAIFILPYLLFSGYAGGVTDRFAKRSVLIAAKAAEIAIMTLGLAALVTGHIGFMLAVLFLVAAQATFFSPARLGILPEMLPANALPQANGLLEMSRYGAIILGTALGGVMLAAWDGAAHAVGLVLIAVAAAGFVASLGITRVPPSGTDKRFRLNPWGEIAGGVRRLRADRRLVSAVAGLTYFDSLGTLVLLDMILVGKETMALDDALTGLLGAFVGIGIAIGSVVAGRLARGRVALGMVPPGAIGVGIGVAALSATAEWYDMTAAVLVLTGFSAGFIIVPFNTLLQRATGRTERGHVIATSNFLNMAVVLASSGLLWLLHDVLGMTPGAILLLAGLTTLAVAAGALRCLPRTRLVAANADHSW